MSPEKLAIALNNGLCKRPDFNEQFPIVISQIPLDGW